MASQTSSGVLLHGCMVVCRADGPCSASFFKLFRLSDCCAAPRALPQQAPWRCRRRTKGGTTDDTDRGAGDRAVPRRATPGAWTDSDIRRIGIGLADGVMAPSDASYARVPCPSSGAMVVQKQ